MQDTATTPRSLSYYPYLRLAVIVGYLIGLLLLFMADVGDEYANIEVIRYNLSNSPAMGLYGLLTVAARIVFLVLIVFHPRKLVFILGAAWAGFVLLGNLVQFGPSLDWGTLQLLLRLGGLLILAHPFQPQSPPRAEQA